MMYVTASNSLTTHSVFADFKGLFSLDMIRSTNPPTHQPTNSEAFASELLENLKEMFSLYNTNSDVFSNSHIFTTHWSYCINPTPNIIYPHYTYEIAKKILCVSPDLILRRLRLNVISSSTALVLLI